MGLQINVKGVSFSDGLIVLSVISEEKACLDMLLSRGKCCYLYEKGEAQVRSFAQYCVAIHSHMMSYESYLYII